ncbi:MAG: phosphonate C-P lyase system protein PhnL [Hyphomicrobiales bacterium]|nr:phosphonate C-P lyase system protein PhnL [Hyphomicrobiales bacterium]
MLKIEKLCKEFTLHQQGGVRISVLDNVSLEVSSGETVAVTGPSGRGKSSLLKLIYGSYKATSGAIRLFHDGSWVDATQAEPRDMIKMRQQSIGYVTQFLRVIPRVPAVDIVTEPLIERGVAPNKAEVRAKDLLSRLNIPEKLWQLSPMTFSGGEQQRVNIARGFAAHHPVLLLDEPTASLDDENRDRVLTLVAEARSAGSAIVAVFHDEAERRRACDREVSL